MKENLIIYGTGNDFRRIWKKKIIKEINGYYNITYFVDKNCNFPLSIKRYKCCRQIKEYNNEKIFITSTYYYNEISSELTESGVDKKNILPTSFLFNLYNKYEEIIEWGDLKEKILSLLVPLGMLRGVAKRKYSIYWMNILKIKFCRILLRGRVKPHNILDKIDAKKVFNVIDTSKYSYRVFNMCYLNEMLGKALVSLEFGMLPLFEVSDIDGENYFDIYFQNNYIGDIYKKCRSDRVMERSSLGAPFFADGRTVKVYNIIYEHYFKLKPDIQYEYDREINKIRASIRNNGILYGCVVRGTDYVLTKPAFHPVQPELNVLIKKFREKLNSNDRIYFVSDEKKITDIFVKEFPGQIVTSHSEYYDIIYKMENKSIGDVHFKRSNDKYLRGFEYFERVYILSKCDAYIGGMSGAVRIAEIMNGDKWDYKDIINVGVY